MQIFVNSAERSNSPVYSALPCTTAHILVLYTLVLFQFIEALEKLPSIEDQSQCDCVTTPARSDSTAAAGLGRATPHASSR